MKSNQKHKPTVFFIEWATHGRELDMQLPIIYFFEKILKWNVYYKSAFNWPSIIKKVPDMILISGTVGAKIGVDWSRRIEKANIPLFTQVTEGNYRENDIYEFVWGHAKDTKRLSENLSMLWSYNAYQMSVKAYPETKSVFRVSGAVGFDKYKFVKMTKFKNLDRKKVIGYASFDFNKLLEDKNLFKRYGNEIFVRQKKQAIKCKSILSYLAKTFPDILFLIKPHPGDGNRTPLELVGLEGLDNVKIDYNIKIQDAISLSDLWLNYNSSTNLEAWLMNKPSITFLTNEKYFSSEIIRGSIIEDDPKKIGKMINEFYNVGKIKRFDKLNTFRKSLIKDSIGYPDGMNHVRFMSFLRPYIEKIEKGEMNKGKWKLNKKEKLIGIVKHILYTLTNGKPWIPFFGRYSSFYGRFSLKELENEKKSFNIRIEDFYKQNLKKIKFVYMNHANNFNNTYLDK